VLGSILEIDGIVKNCDERFQKGERRVHTQKHQIQEKETHPMLATFETKKKNRVSEIRTT
jgi:hypothetical protein